MSAILNSLNDDNLPIIQPILMILVPKFMVHRVLSDKTYLSLGLLSPLRYFEMMLYIIKVLNMNLDFFGVKLQLSKGARSLIFGMCHHLPYHS